MGVPPGRSQGSHSIRGDTALGWTMVPKTSSASSPQQGPHMWPESWYLVVRGRVWGVSGTALELEVAVDGPRLVHRGLGRSKWAGDGGLFLSWDVASCPWTRRPWVSGLWTQTVWPPLCPAALLSRLQCRVTGLLHCRGQFPRRADAEMPWTAGESSPTGLAVWRAPTHSQMEPGKGLEM